ncbi:MAG: transglycosylase SLT domain-containing protein [Alphaproteobacteria bacterium]|nr:transglycosylase SLT domain-containing protein [Alphaproteobacteria bacterium]
MLTGQNSSISSNLEALKSKAGAKIASAIQTASTKTGVDFSYLLQQAQVESSFKSDAKAGTSSATGLYQFIDSTWLSMVNRYGDKYGLSQYADQISDAGKVSSKQTKSEILSLRNNPEICSLMAGELASENKNYLENCVGGDIGSTELYMAHFMGPGGAGKFLKALRSDPTASAADAFPQAAAANKNVFYTKSGQEKSLAEVYAFFDNKFQIESDAAVACSAENSSDLINQVADQNVIAATVKQGYDHIYNQKQQSWVRVKSSATASMSSSWTPTDNLGGITGLTKGFASPIDILELLKTDHTRQGRYNS